MLGSRDRFLVGQFDLLELAFRDRRLANAFLGENDRTVMSDLDTNRLAAVAGKIHPASHRSAYFGYLALHLDRLPDQPFGLGIQRVHGDRRLLSERFADLRIGAIHAQGGSSNQQNSHEAIMALWGRLSACGGL